MRKHPFPTAVSHGLEFETLLDLKEIDRLGKNQCLLQLLVEARRKYVLSKSQWLIFITSQRFDPSP